MNDISIVGHIKNDIEFLEQFWKHIHSYNPREVVLIDTGSIDGTWEALQYLEKNPQINYKIEQFPHYTGMVYTFNKVIEMATSTWVIKLDADELLSQSTQRKIFEVIRNDEFNCISIPTVHHFINSDLFFNCTQTHPDYHQRIFKKSVFKENVSIGSMNHGSLMWNEPLIMLTLNLNHSLYHYSLLRPFEKLQKRSIVNYFIDIEKITDKEWLKYAEENINYYIDAFKRQNTKVVPAWQTEPTIIPFNDLEDYYISEFKKWGERVWFKKPEDLIVHKISDWPKAEKQLEGLIK